MSSMLYYKYNIEIWNFHIIAFWFYSQFVQCPNFYGIGFVVFGTRISFKTLQVAALYTTYMLSSKAESKRLLKVI